jgi:hypothetical protein
MEYSIKQNLVFCVVNSTDKKYHIQFAGFYYAEWEIWNRGNTNFFSWRDKSRNCQIVCVRISMRITRCFDSEFS